MNSKLNITNTLSGKKETFVPIDKKKSWNVRLWTNSL